MFVGLRIWAQINYGHRRLEISDYWILLSIAITLAGCILTSLIISKDLYYDKNPTPFILVPSLRMPLKDIPAYLHVRSLDPNMIVDANNNLWFVAGFP